MFNNKSINNSLKGDRRSLLRLRGFTLVEIMVVLVIIGILAYFIVPNLVGSVDDARITKAKLEITSLQNALTMYRVDNGIYPTTEQGLQSLVLKPTDDPIPVNWRRKYIDKLPKDPWGREYQYRNPGKNSDIDIFSFGPKGPNDNDEGYIGSWDIN